MAPRGRKPKPTHLKLVQNTARPHRIKPNEPKPNLALPMPPPDLSDEAKVEWGRIANELYQLGLLSNLDRAVLAAYCQLYGRWIQAERELAEQGFTVETSKGNIIQNPLVGIANKAAADMVRYAAEFGMTPSARTRIDANPQGEEEDEAAEFFTA